MHGTLAQFYQSANHALRNYPERWQMVQGMLLNKQKQVIRPPMIASNNHLRLLRRNINLSSLSWVAPQNQL